MTDLITRVGAQLERHEGRRALPYRDSVGKMTIGVGRNLDDNGLRDDEITYLLANDINAAITDAQALVSPRAWQAMSDARRSVLVNMAFNLGCGRLAGFKRMLAALERHDWASAAVEMLDSQWATQVGRRATELATLMRDGC